MKLLKTIGRTLILSAAVTLMLAGYSLRANLLQDILNAGITNGAVGGGYWRATTGNYSIASYDLLYNFTTQSNSLGAGLIVGGDYMWSKHNGYQNDVKGGFALNYTVAPLQSVGFTNLVLKAYAGDAVATPHSSGVGVGNIAFAGVDWSVKVYKTVNFHLAPAWQTRTGQGAYSRSYVGIQGFFSLGF